MKYFILKKKKETFACELMRIVLTEPNIFRDFVQKSHIVESFWGEKIHFSLIVLYIYKSAIGGGRKNEFSKIVDRAARTRI